MKDQIQEYLIDLSDFGHSIGAEGYLINDHQTAKILAQEISEIDFWQPIETAPKDGTLIQGWDDYYGHLGYIMMTGYGFWTVDGLSPVFPSKWQPLPNPPKNV